MRSQYANLPVRVFGHQMYLNPDDFSPVSTSIASTGWLDLPLTEVLKKILRPGMVALDVGANIGYYTLLFAKGVGKSGKVYSFEPESLNFSLLTKSVSANHLNNVELRKEVLSDSQGTTILYLSDPGLPQGHSLIHDFGKGVVKVRSTTVDDFWISIGKPRIGLMKIHVSGADDLVLMGAKRLIEEVRPYIAFVFVAERWTGHPNQLRNLFDLYEVYELIQSPLLVRRIDRPSLLERSQVGVFLVPRKR